MQYIVLGASGFIGSQLFTDLKTKQQVDGSSVVIGTCHSQFRKELVPFDLRSSDLSTLAEQTSFNMHEPFIVVNAAFYGDPETCALKPTETSLVNVQQTCQFAFEVEQAGGQFVYLSTSYVFSGNEIKPPAESVLPDPVCEYGRQKRTVEKYLNENCPHSLTFRLGKVVDTSKNTNHLLSHWQNQLERQKPLYCIEGQLLTLLNVRELLPAIQFALDEGLTGLYHLAPEPAAILRSDLAQLFLDRTKLPGKVELTSWQSLNLNEPRPLNASLSGQRFSQKTGHRFSNAEEIVDEFQGNL